MVRALQSAYEQVSGLDGTPVNNNRRNLCKGDVRISSHSDQASRVKGNRTPADEWMDIKDIIMNAKIYALSLYKLAK